MMPLPVMECPCQRYLSTDNVLKVLETRAIRSRSNGDGDDELDRLVQWISGTQQLLLGNPPSIDQKQVGVVVVESHQPPCTPLHGQCRNRVPCSFRLLNDVRQACQPFIAADVVKKKPAATTSTTKRTAAVDQPAINLDSKTEFPALSRRRRRRLQDRYHPCDPKRNGTASDRRLSLLPQCQWRAIRRGTFVVPTRELPMLGRL
jgi:hypothetical protein